MNANVKKSSMAQIQEKFYESLREKEKIYKELEEQNKNNIEEESINVEFNYPYYIYQELKNKENDKKNIQEEKEESEINEKKGSKNKKIQLIKTNMKYNILYEY
jgi:hypothetical protein